MLCWGNTPVLLVGLLVLLAGWPVLGQGEAPALAVEDGEAAFEWVQGWVRSEKGVPADADLPQRPVSGLFGVYVTLREDGRVLGRGQALREDVSAAIDKPGPAVQLATLAAAATRQALDELRDTQMKRALELKIDEPELFKQALIATRQRVQVDVQLGHNLESIVLPNDGEDGAVFATFAPGFHGLRMASPVAGEPTYAWPATELSRNTSPLRVVLRLLDQQGFDAEDLPLIARADGPALQRFEVMHMVRPGPAQPMRHLIRGNMILQQQVVDGRTISGLAERTARFLDQLIVEDQLDLSLRVRGVYQPSMQRYAPEWSEPRQAALLAYALTRHARVQLDAEPDAAGQALLGRVRRALRLIEQMERTAMPEPGKVKHLTAAFMLMTLCESPVNLEPPQLAMRQRLGKALLDLRHPDGGGFRVMAGSDKRLPRASAAVVTAALAIWHAQTGERKHIEPIWSVLSDLMQVNKEDPRVIDLVWVSHAITRVGERMAKNHPDADKASTDLKAWRKALADYLTLLGEQQILGKPVLGPPDVVGGFILKAVPPGSPPNPTWQSAMPLSVIAMGLRDSEIVAPDRTFGPLLTAQLGARFLGQLMITRPSAFYLRDIEPALGGVRNTLWDNTLYPDCSSMVLLALAELQQTLRELEPEELEPEE